jgi:hypothetical protein
VCTVAIGGSGGTARYNIEVKMFLVYLPVEPKCDAEIKVFS